MALYRYQQNADTQSRFTRVSLRLDNGLTALIELGKTYDLTPSELVRASQFIVMVPSTDSPTQPFDRIDLPVAGVLSDGDVPSWDSATRAFIPTAITANGGPIQEADLASDVVTKLNTRVPAGRVGLGSIAAPADLGTDLTMSLLATDDQGQVNAYVRLTGDGTLTISGVQLVSWCTIRVFVVQDATGNHSFAIKNLVNGKVDQITVDLTPGVATFTYCYTDDSANMVVVGPDSSVSSGGGGGGGGGISNPTFTGTMGAGNVLTATAPPELLASTVAWQWQTSPNGITWTDLVGNGATTNAYTQQSADTGKLITPRVSGTPFARATPVLIPSTSISYVGTAQQGTATATSLHVIRPTGATDGDVLFATISVPAGGAVTITIPATTGGTDWTPMGAGQVQGGAAGPTGRWQDTGGSTWFTYWKRLAGGDATTTWNFTASASATYRSRAVAFRNAISTGTPFEGFAAAFSGSGTTFNAQSLTPTATNEMYVCGYAYNASFTTTFGTGLPLTQAAAADYQNFAYASIATSGTATGVTAATVSGAARKLITAWLITHA